MYNIVYQYNKQKHHQKNRPFDGAILGSTQNYRNYRLNFFNFLTP